MAKAGDIFSGAAGGASAGAALGPWGAAAGGVLGGLGGLIAGNESAEDEARAAEMRKKALEAYTNIKIPTIEEQMIALKHQQSVGDLNPEAEFSEGVDPSEMAKVQVDPRLREAQMAALTQMQGLGKTGLSAEDSAALGKIRRTVAGDAQGRDEALKMEMMARNKFGAGDEIAMRTIASQAAANRQLDQSESQAAMAQKKALDAIYQAGGMANQMRSQAFGEDSAKASAQDVINRYAHANRASVQQRNVGGRNDAQRYNLSKDQTIANNNVGLDNQSQMHNKGLHQTKFSNDLAIAQGTSGAYNNQSSDSRSDAAGTRNQWGAILSGAGKTATGIAAYNKGNEYAEVDQDVLDGKKVKKASVLPASLSSTNGVRS
jgi:hypothetical protein